jgi:hypothetical protein
VILSGLIKYEASPVGDVAATNWAMIQISGLGSADTIMALFEVERLAAGTVANHFPEIIAKFD